MKSTIYKYPLEITDEQFIEVPIGTEFLTVMYQDDNLFIWGKHQVKEVDIKKNRKIVIVGTGNVFDDSDKTYIGSVQRRQFVWHVYEG